MSGHRHPQMCILSGLSLCSVEIQSMQLIEIREQQISSKHK